jgi:competence protein ComFC
MTTRYRLYHAFWVSVDWMYPPVCGGCGKNGTRWCQECQDQVKKIQDDICPRCGSNEPHNVICNDCQNNPPPYDACRSWGQYSGPLREAIHRLKYQNDIGLAEVLSIHLIELFYSTDWKIDVITAVPLGLKRRSQRGYNQSNLLALPLALATNVNFNPSVIERTRETASQVGLSAPLRQENVRGAFVSRQKLVQDKVVLIIDDVKTTGATLNACAQSLLDGGAKQVYCLTLAKSMLKDDIQIASQVIHHSNGYLNQSNPRSEELWR